MARTVRRGYDICSLVLVETLPLTLLNDVDINLCVTGHRASHPAQLGFTVTGTTRPPACWLRRRCAVVAARRHPVYERIKRSWDSRGIGEPSWAVRQASMGRRRRSSS